MNLSPAGFDRIMEAIMRYQGQPRYILNKTWGGLRVIVHDRHNLSEACNTDQIKKRGESDILLPSWKRCRWCLGE